MPSPVYWSEKINEAINNPKGDHASLIVERGRYINDLLKHYEEYLDKENFSGARYTASELMEYISRNYKQKFKTVGYARELVSKLKKLLGYNPNNY